MSPAQPSIAVSRYSWLPSAHLHELVLWEVDVAVSALNGLMVTTLPCGRSRRNVVGYFCDERFGFVRRDLHPLLEHWE